MCLPLVDGVFVAVVLGGTLDSVAGIVEVGLLVFGGSAMVAVILAEMDSTPRRQARTVATVGAVVIVGAAIQAAIAPTVESFLNMEIFERFAALVVLAVAASTASAKVEEYLPSPVLVIGLGVLATLTPETGTLAIQTDLELVARAVAAASIGVGFGLLVAITSPWLRGLVALDRFRFGSAVALGVLAASIAGFVPSDAPVALMVLAVTALLAFDPDGSAAADGETTPDEQSHSVDDTAVVAESRATADGGAPDTVGSTNETGSSTDQSEDSEIPTEGETGVGPGQERPSWL